MKILNKIYGAIDRQLCLNIAKYIITYNNLTRDGQLMTTVFLRGMAV